MHLTEMKSNRQAFRSQKARHPELEKDYHVDNKRQYGCAVTIEMYHLKALAITKELSITDFKATLCLCQVAAREQVPTWLVAGIWFGAAWQRPSTHSTCTPRWPLLESDSL